MATAVQSFSGMLRRQIEETLAAKGGARLQLAPRLVRDGVGTGFAGLDAVLPGGFPVAGTTEIVGSRSSGRATIAAAYLAERTREGLVCAWVDVGGDLTPEAAAANGVDLARVLWVRCGGKERNAEDEEVARRTQRAELKLVDYGRDKTIGTRVWRIGRWERCGRCRFLRIVCRSGGEVVWCIRVRQFCLRAMRRNASRVCR